MTDYLYDIVEDNPHWVQSTLELAFYADQQAAARLLERLIIDTSIDVVVQLTPEMTVSKPRFLLECLVGPDNDEYQPSVPRYWPWCDEYDNSFEWEPSVENRLRALVVETGVADTLPDDWRFEDLSF